MGYEGGHGTWPTEGPSGQLLLAAAGRDRVARELLDEWRRAAVPLTSVISFDRLLVALVHEPSRLAVVSRA